MPATQTHLADDELAVRDAFAAEFGESFIAQYGFKTTKTMCGKRASFSNIVRSNPSCEACQAALVARREERERSIEALLELATNPNTDAINARCAQELLEVLGIR